MIEFFVPGLPIAQPRHKVAQGRNQKFPRAYIDTKHPVHDWKAVVKLAASKFAPIEGPVRLTLMFVFPRPSNMIWKKRPMPRDWHTKKPDRDNLEKSVKDALKGIAWGDDSQVCSGPIDKIIGAQGEPCGAYVKVEAIEGEPPPYIPLESSS